MSPMCALYGPYMSPMCALYEPYMGPMSAVYEPYISPMSALYEPYISPMSALCRPYMSPSYNASFPLAARGTIGEKFELVFVKSHVVGFGPFDDVQEVLLKD